MEIEICEIGYDKKEYIKIGCHKVDSNVREIVHFIKSRQGSIDVKDGEMKYNIPIVDIFYVESVDDRTFIYLENDCYETAHKLYELEEILNERRFIRISKSVIVNLLKIDCVKPALNGRYMCRLKNNENVIISRKYVPEFKERLNR
ncbi:MAG: LytTR family transcriptional regulator DNA-binding domain-containing protein [Lachnospiraceae bacterium]|nr:LytTR family transcriptional regulator DNA-binding domain-containing protein [Lachnospiraceae bacterium]MBP5746694.1 LytTR family transcriptional regulator DNA-binding domain-containing protein [Lachnospiraceae bacterium]